MKEQTYLTFEQVKQLLPQFSDAMQIGRIYFHSLIKQSIKAIL